jgi:hypothetical protein
VPVLSVNPFLFPHHIALGHLLIRQIPSTTSYLIGFMRKRSTAKFFPVHRATVEPDLGNEEEVAVSQQTALPRSTLMLAGREDKASE